MRQAKMQMMTLLLIITLSVRRQILRQKCEMAGRQRLADDAHCSQSAKRATPIKAKATPPPPRTAAQPTPRSRPGRWSMVDVLGSSSNNHRRPHQLCYPIPTYSTATTTAIIGNHVGGRSIR